MTDFILDSHEELPVDKEGDTLLDEVARSLFHSYSGEQTDADVYKQADEIITLVTKAIEKELSV